MYKKWHFIFCPSLIESCHRPCTLFSSPSFVPCVIPLIYFYIFFLYFVMTFLIESLSFLSFSFLTLFCVFTFTYFLPSWRFFPRLCVKVPCTASDGSQNFIPSNFLQGIFFRKILRALLPVNPNYGNRKQQSVFHQIRLFILVTTLTFWTSLEDSTTERLPFRNLKVSLAHPLPYWHKCKFYKSLGISWRNECQQYTNYFTSS